MWTAKSSKKYSGAFKTPHENELIFEKNHNVTFHARSTQLPDLSVGTLLTQMSKFTRIKKIPVWRSWFFDLFRARIAFWTTVRRARRPNNKLFHTLLNAAGDLDITGLGASFTCVSDRGFANNKQQYLTLLNLTWVDLTYVNLTYVDQTSGDLKYVDLTHIELTFVDLPTLAYT